MPARRAILIAGTLLLMTSLLWAHDLFLKLDTYFLEPHARVRIPVLNGTFAESEGFVAPERIADISAVSPGGRTRLSPATAWSCGPDSTSLLSVDLGDAGTYVVGVSTRPREIELRAEDVNAYLEEDGRSEEHTSELQSQSNLVCRLLLEKKKKIKDAAGRLQHLLVSHVPCKRALQNLGGIPTSFHSMTPSCTSRATPCILHNHILVCSSG